MNKAIFLDRDGVINSLYRKTTGEKGYILKWDDFEWCEGAIEGLRLLAETDFKLIVVSNQSCIGRGLVDHLTIHNIFAQMTHEFNTFTKSKDKLDWIFCPHKPDDSCCCRKPKPGMFYIKAIHLDIVLESSWMIGDQASDIIAAYRANITQRIKVGEPLDLMQRWLATHTVNSLLEAAELIHEVS